jgi:hypothetical protein
MRSMWISEQTLISTLYNNELSVLISQKEIVYCAVRIRLHFVLKRLIVSYLTIRCKSYNRQIKTDVMSVLSVFKCLLCLCIQSTFRSKNVLIIIALSCQSISLRKLIFGRQVIPLCISTVINLYTVRQHNCIVYNPLLGLPVWVYIRPSFRALSLKVIKTMPCSDYMCCYCMGSHSHLLLKYIYKQLVKVQLVKILVKWLL